MKYCNKCGAEGADEAKFCPRCGESFAVASQLDQGPVTFSGADMGGTNKATYGASGTMEAPKNNTMLWLIINIAVTVLCCCTGGGLLSIIGIVFAVLAMNKYKAGDIAGGKNFEKVAMIMAFVAIGISIILGLIMLVTGFYGGFMEGFADGFNGAYYY
jgi:hypothetical protein